MKACYQENVTLCPFVCSPSAVLKLSFPRQKTACDSQQKIKEYKQWMEEQKANNKVKPYKSASGTKKLLVVDTFLVETKMEERRQRWIQECTPWRFVVIRHGFSSF